MFEEDPRLDELVHRFKICLYANCGGFSQGAVHRNFGRFVLSQYHMGSWDIAVESGCGGYNTIFRLHGSSVMHLHEDVWELLTLMRTTMVLEDLADV